MTTAETSEYLALRLRQAALGCTSHGHGPLNALVVVIEGHQRGELDGVGICNWLRGVCDDRLAELDPHSMDAMRERKVRLIATVVGRGLEAT